VIDRFSSLLQELGTILLLPLSLDKYNACSIEISPIIIQMQLDATQETLFFFSKIIELPPGRFREDVLAEALKANNLPDPRAAIFGYLAITNHLTLHQNFPLSILNGERLAGMFGAFYELGKSWHTAIESGRTAPPANSDSIPLGMRP